MVGKRLFEGAVTLRLSLDFSLRRPIGEGELTYSGCSMRSWERLMESERGLYFYIGVDSGLL